MNLIQAVKRWTGFGGTDVAARTGAEEGQRRDASATLPGVMPGFLLPEVQGRWMGVGLEQYTPQRVMQVYYDACGGDLVSQWELFDLMESTWPELSKNLNQLKDAVWLAFLQGAMEVKPWRQRGEEPSEEAERRASVVEEALWGMRPKVEKDENDLEDSLRDLMDARGKGLSVLETDWEVRPSAALGGRAMVAPRCTRWVHPSWYGYPQRGGLMLRAGGGGGFGAMVERGWVGNGGQWLEFPEHKFVIGLCKNKTGHPLGSAMLHVLSTWWAFSNFTTDWFINFAQMYGQPIRWATYDPAMGAGDQAKLQAMLANMGSSAWGMFPRGTQLEMKEASKGAGDSVHAQVLALANKVCDLVVLRQTLTSDVSQNAGSLAQGEVHERVLGKVEMVCALWAGKSIQSLVRSICVLNFGDDRECPYLGLKDEEEEDPVALGQLLQAVSTAGLEPEDDAIEELGARLGFKVRRKTGFSDGMAEDPLKGRQDAQDGQDKALKGPEVPEEPEAPEAPEVKAAGTERTADEVDAVAARRAKVLGDVYRGAMAPFRQALLASTSPEDALERVAAVYADWSGERVAAEVETALQLCAAEGVAADKANR